MCSINGANEPFFGQVAVMKPTDIYEPMEIPEHIYLNGVPRKPVNNETRPTMIVPERITLVEGEATIASKAQPTEVTRDRENLLPSSENEGININGIPDLLTVNELPHDDFNQRQNDAQNQTPKNHNYHYQSSSVAVEANPLNELKCVRRNVRYLAKRVNELELDNKCYQSERPYLIMACGISFFLALVALCRPIRR